MMKKINGDINNWILDLMEKGLSVKEIKNLSKFELMNYGMYEKLDNIYEDEEVKIFMLTEKKIESLIKTCVFWCKPRNSHTLYEYDKKSGEYYYWGHLDSNGSYIFTRVRKKEVKEKNKRKGKLVIDRTIHPKAKEYLETKYEEFGENENIFKFEKEL
ncbi:hypothetical protein [uncultured Cetobacterium sp.]|uniref:hypothetical protein n=1 Tax=uncultured Cetobacterium sp. TaxID=527638 RepID=UPI0026083C40|nr:hypothetical protein [uncultured Cetobacterium sp.]